MSSSITKKKEKKKEREKNLYINISSRNKTHDLHLTWIETRSKKNKMQEETLTSFEGEENFTSMLDRVFRWQKNNKV